MKWEGCGRKRSWPNLRHYPGSCPEGLRKTTKNLSQDSLFPGRDSVLSSQQTYHVSITNISHLNVIRKITTLI
jgi:hypothetical protein